jgi:hypothetical protein
MMNRENKEIYLPPVKFRYMHGMSWRPSYPHAFMGASAFDVSIDTYNLTSYLKKTDELLRDLTTAVDASNALRDGTSFWYREKTQQKHDYWLQPGRMIPMERAPWKRLPDSDDYITVMERDITTKRCDHVGHTIYISMAAHEKILREVQMNIHSVIVEQVARGVAGGVQKAIQEGTATLKDIQTEKAKLEAQLKRIEKEEQKAIERDAAKAARQAQPRLLAGYVYVLRQVGGTHYKIGRTVNPNDRLRTFSVKLPFAVEYEILIPTPNCYSLEVELHELYASKRVDGEWFSLDDSDLEYLRGLTE